MTTEAITPLRQRMIEDMSSRKLCVHTQRSHIYSCKRFAAFLKRSPDTATYEDIRLFQLHLAETASENLHISGCEQVQQMERDAVGTRVTSRPPLRSGRAAFPHTAPTSGIDGNSVP